MMDMDRLFELAETGAIETYRGDVDVIVDKRRNACVLEQGERLLVLSLEQAVDLIQVMICKLN